MMNQGKKNQNTNWKVAQSKFIESTIGTPFYVKGTGISHLKKGEINKKRGILSHYSGLLWVLSGTLEMYDGPKCILAGANHICFNLSGEDTWKKGISNDCSFRWLTFSGPLADAILLSYRYSRHQIAQYPYPEKLFERLDSLMNNDSTFHTRIKAAIVLEILAYTAGNRYEVNENQRSIDNALALIKQNLSDVELGVDFLCECLNTSATTLNRIFQEQLEVSPGRYILDQRLQLGMGLLSGSDQSIAEITEKCGFRNPKTFSRFIRRATGFSARDFRKQQHSGKNTAS